MEFHLNFCRADGGEKVARRPQKNKPKVLNGEEFQLNVTAKKPQLVCELNVPCTDPVGSAGGSNPNFCNAADKTDE